MAFRRIGRFGKRDLLAQRGDDLVIARRVGSFAFGCQTAQGRHHVGGIELVELLDVSNDPGDLWSKDLELFVVQLEMSKLGDFRDVFLFYRHNLLLTLRKRESRIKRKFI